MTNQFKYLFTFVLILSSILSSRAQDPRIRSNLPNYFEGKLHFGFTIGINRGNFIIEPADHLERYNCLTTIESFPKLGFNLGIVSELRLQRYLTLRFIPNLSFAERNLQYSFAGCDTANGKPAEYTNIKSIESTFLNFPLDLKLRSARIKNFAAYVLAGGGYSLDLASKRNTKNSNDPDEQIVKLQRDDFSYEGGAGAEFFLEYFKFAIEFKVTMGLKNLLINDNTKYSNTVETLHSKIFLVSFTFEG